MKPRAIALYENAFHPLVSVIPPQAPLSPGSRIPPSQRGKCPGRKRANGTWSGYPYLVHVPTLAEVKQWAQDGANIGILAAYYPSVDIDILLPWLSAEVARIAQRVLGWAPSRVGQPPKQLLMYRTGAPFGRMAVIIHLDGESHLVEVLGRGRQYLIEGQHPNGHRYTWDTDLLDLHPDIDLTWITQDDVERFLTELKDLLELLPGVEVTRVASGKERTSDAPQADLRAPSLEALRECVAAIPNTDALFPTREDYIKIGYAVRAAVAEDEDEDGFMVFADWAGRHERDGRVEGNPETWRSDWRRMAPPYAVGWPWLSELAARCGFNPAQYEFEADAVAAIQEERERRAEWSDAWLVERVIEEHGDLIRYVPATRRWYVYVHGRWEPDAVHRADHLVECTLLRIASALQQPQRGASEAERQQNRKIAKELSAAKKHKDVRHLLQIENRITAPQEAFDNDPWILNTPGGMIDLRSGELLPHDPAAMCARQTRVAPDFDTPAPVWQRFLMEITAGDVQLQEYLRRLMGYALTGRTTEQMLAFFHGGGRNGKGTFLHAFEEILASYAETAPMDTFTAGTHGHPTDLAGLMGARLVTAVETESGHRWDEQRIKLLTGGDSIRARFMRRDFFTYVPQFTLIFSGNHRPEIRNLDEAMRRRLHLVPFTVTFTAEEDDRQLKDKLRLEYPAILAWALKGCRAWRDQGLRPPSAVVSATAEYFEAEDPVGRWIEECCREVPEHWSPARDLYSSWGQWAGAQGEYVGSIKWLSQALQMKQYEKVARGPRPGFMGLQVVETPVDELVPGG